MSFFLSSSCKSLFFLGSYWESLFCCGLCRVVKESDSLVKRSRSQDLKSHLSIEADEIHRSDSQEVHYLCPVLFSIFLISKLVGVFRS